MRLFVGIGVSRAMEEAVAEWSRAHDAFPVRWITGQNLHVTLVPPWEGEPESALGQLKRVPLSAEVSLRFHTVSFGPSPRAPRLVWAKGDASPALTRLRSDALEVFGVVPTYARFRLHLTLARFRPETWKHFPSRELCEQVEWRDEVRALRLYRSHLLPGGAEYEVLAEVPCIRER